MKGFSLLISVCLLLIISCNPNATSDFAVKIKQDQGITYVENPANPKNGRNHYTLKEEYTLDAAEEQAGLPGEPGRLIMDKKGNFYVIDYQGLRVLKFAKDGKFIKSFARQGQGPGELGFARDYLIDQETNTIHILDNNNNKITRYTTDGEFLADIRLEKVSPSFFYLVQGKYYFVFYDFSDETLHQYTKIEKYSVDGHILSKSDPWFSYTIQVIHRDGLTLTGGAAFSPKAYFAVDTKGILYYAHSSKYEFTAYNYDFNKLMVMTKPEPERVKIPKEKIALELAEKNERRKRRGRPPIPNWFVYPEYYPIFKSFFISDKDRLMVKTYTRDIDVHIDVFDSDGVYLEEMVMHPPSDGSLLDEVLSGAVFRDGCIYCMVMNKEDQYVIRKYRIVPYNEK